MTLQRTIGLSLILALLQAGPGLAQTTSAPLSAAAVALMGGQRAVPLRGRFNNVPVLHSNQPEEILGPGILIDTAPGLVVSEAGQPIRNPAYRFNGPFGLHLHHHFSPGTMALGRDGRRSELTLAALISNPGPAPVRVSLLRGAVRNSFEAPYQGHQLLGVKPLGPRPWNTGPGDATSVQMLRGRLDNNLAEPVTIPGHGRIVLFRTVLPAEGVANALLRGQSDGPFDMAIVAAPGQADDRALEAVLDRRQLAPGRTYLNQLAAIDNREVFSRVSGVALGDGYTASLSHDLSRDGALHLPLTTTSRQTFGTGDVQVNRLVSRMPDSSLDNVGTYGVRFDLQLRLRGSGAYALMLSHPRDPAGRSFIAFRGSVRLLLGDRQEDVHVGLRSGESLSLSTLQLQQGETVPLELSLVYPADATPGHLLSVVPLAELATRDRTGLLPSASIAMGAPASVGRPSVRDGQPIPETPPVAAIPSGPSASTRLTAVSPGLGGRTRALRSTPLPQARPGSRVSAPIRPPVELLRQRRGLIATPPLLRPSSSRLRMLSAPLADRYRQALDAQERLMRSWQAP